MAGTPVSWRFFIALWLVCCSVPAAADGSARDELPAIALIIDDLGNRQGLGKRVVNLPGPVACAQ